MRPLSELRSAPGGGPDGVRTVYADLDGTILGPGGSLYRTPRGASGRGAEALGRLAEAGVDLVLVSGRTREQMREAARILGASAHVAEMGAFVVERPADGPEAVEASFGAFRGPGNPHDAMARSGVGGFLLDRHAGRLEPHSPWAFAGREATMLFRGLVDPAAATAELAEAAYGWVELLDNGIIRRTFDFLPLPQVHAYHLVPRGVSKLTGVRLHMERHGLGPGECLGIGDSLADLALSSAVGALVVVGNGVEAIGAAADDLPNVYAASAPAGDGFAEAVDVLLGGGPSAKG